MLGLALFLALTVGLAAALVALRRWRSPAAQALAFAVAWTLAEPLRGGLGLQFPWNPIASVWAVSDASLQTVAFTGTYGLSLLTVAAAGLTAPLFMTGPIQRRAAVAVPVLFACAVLALGALRLAMASAVPDTGVQLRIVQANVAQHHKWDPEKRLMWFRRHLELSATAHNPPPRVIVWPESAVPYDIDAQQEVRDYLAPVVPPGGALLVGGDRYELEREPPAAHNTLFALGDRAQVLARYDKVDLVPFGEFLPFRGVLGQLGLGKLTQGSIDFMPGPGRVTLRVAGLPAASPLICYEAAFPGVRHRRRRPAGLAGEHHQRRLVRSQLRPVPASGHGADAGGRGGPPAGSRRQHRDLGGDRRLWARPRAVGPEPDGDHRHGPARRAAGALLRTPPRAVRASGLAHGNRRP